MGFLTGTRRSNQDLLINKLNVVEHVSGKKWENIKKLWPQHKYQEFIQNVKSIQMMYMPEWSRVNHKYLITKVSQILSKPCAIWEEKFESDDQIWVLPCMDIMHFRCLKSRFKGFLFVYQKRQACVCEIDIQEMYNTVKRHWLKYIISN